MNLSIHKFPIQYCRNLMESGTEWRAVRIFRSMIVDAFANYDRDLIEVFLTKDPDPFSD